MIIKTNWTIPCAGCGTVHTAEKEWHPLEIGETPLPLPKEWATATVSIQEPVISENMERLHEMMESAGVPSEYTSLMADTLRQSSPSFQATFVVCPDCQTGGLWSAVKAEMRRATEKNMQQFGSQFAERGNVLRFPFGSGMPDGLDAPTNEEEH